MAWERNEWTIGRGFRRHRDDQIGFFKSDDRLDLTKICPRSRAGKQNLLTENEGLGWNRMQWDKPGSMWEICERLSHKEDVIVLRACNS